MLTLKQNLEKLISDIVMYSHQVESSFFFVYRVIFLLLCYYCFYYESFAFQKQDIVTDFSQGMRGKVYQDSKLVSPGKLVLQTFLFIHTN